VIQDYLEGLDFEVVGMEIFLEAASLILVERRPCEHSPSLKLVPDVLHQPTLDLDRRGSTLAGGRIDLCMSARGGILGDMVLRGRILTDMVPMDYKHHSNTSQVGAEKKHI